MDELLTAMTNEQSTLVNRCRQFLRDSCAEVSRLLESGASFDPLLPAHNELRDVIVSCLTSSTKSYRYVLPTQVLCKCVDPSLDSHSLQAGYGATGAFDARTIAHQVIVPFDRENHRVLGGSPEPYVNNPLRCPAVTHEYRNQQKNKDDWDKLVGVLDAVEEEGRDDFTRSVFDQILVEVYRLLSNVQVSYPTPNRVSLAHTVEIVERFTATRSGGDRIEVVCTALFRAVALRFGLFDEVRHQKVNVADTVSGMGADIECRLGGKVILLVEVKDRDLTLTQLDAKLDTARVQKISEILFLAQQGVRTAERLQIEQRITSEFSSGQNVYVSNFLDFSRGILVLLGEKGRVQFLSLIGEELDHVHSDIMHRRAWAQLLKSL